MLRDFCTQLLLWRLDPRWFDGELHVDVQGLAFAVAAHSRGMAIRREDETTSQVYEDPGEALAALGLWPIPLPVT